MKRMQARNETLSESMTSDGELSLPKTSHDEPKSCGPCQTFLSNVKKPLKVRRTEKKEPKRQSLISIAFRASFLLYSESRIQPTPQRTAVRSHATPYKTVKGKFLSNVFGFSNCCGFPPVFLLEDH